MELGSETASCLASTPDHHVLSPSNSGHLNGRLSSASSNGLLPSGVSGEHYEINGENELRTEGPANDAICGSVQDGSPIATERGAVEAAKDSDAYKGGDHVLGTDLDASGSSEPVQDWKNEMETGEHLPRWMATAKIAPAASRTETTRSIDNITGSHNVPGKTAPASRRRIFFMIRIPRTADSELKSKIRVAELQLEEASKSRDVIRAALQLKRASKIGLLDRLKVVRDKERACKEEFQKKHLEIDPFQTALNRLKLADAKYKDEIFSEEDLDNKISCLQHRIQHESIPLKEEKQLIREIKKLESQRSQACANDAEHAHLLENFGSKEEIQEQLEVLYGELDVLKANQIQARLECKPIEKDLEELNVEIDELVDQLEAAKHAQAVALATCKQLKKSLNEQNAEFYKYRDVFKRAKELASSKNVEDLAVLCNEQVESMLRCWNSDQSFRERYIKNNMTSTLRRLETLDGRSLGLDEEPPLVMSDSDFPTEAQAIDANHGSDKASTQKEVKLKTPSVSSAEGNQVKEIKGEKGQPQDSKLQKSSSSVSQKKEATESRKSKGQSPQSSKNPSPLSSLATTLPLSIAPPAPVEDAAVKEAQAAQLKEKRRQEEMAKAREAAERKRRQADRAQAKAQLREQKEAERREKERAKKAKRKMAVETGDLQVTETPDIDLKEKELVTEDLPKASVRGSSSEGTKFFTKQPKSQRHSVLNSLSRKKYWQLPLTWLWVSLVIVVVGLALLFVTRS